LNPASDNWWTVVCAKPIKGKTVKVVQNLNEYLQIAGVKVIEWKKLMNTEKPAVDEVAVPAGERI
jgi:hypothetical protein